MQTDYCDEIPFEHGRDRPWRQKLRKFVVVDGSDNVHHITAHFCFNNKEEGLVFRTYPKRSEYTEVTAAFSVGNWKFYKEVQTFDEENSDGRGSKE